MSNNERLFFYKKIDIQDQQELEKLFQLCSIKSVKKGDFLLRSGEVNRYFFYVESGLLRQYSIDEKGKEHIIQFAPEQWFIGDRDSIYSGEPSNYFIQALEDTSVYVLDPCFTAELSLTDSNFNKYNTKLLQNHIKHLQKRINMLLSATAEERYLDFIKTYPDLTLRISQIMIASYLGITPESLSRVRKEMAQRHQKKKPKILIIIGQFLNFISTVLL